MTREAHAAGTRMAIVRCSFVRAFWAFVDANRPGVSLGNTIADASKAERR